MPQLRRFAVLTVCLSLALLLGCAGMKRKEPAGGISRIVDTGELRVGMSGEQPPLTMTAKSGELIGLDVALARVLAQSMGVEAKLVQLSFGDLLGALEDHEVDLVMSGMTITPARSQRVSFVGPYYTSGKSILTKSPKLAAVQVASDLDSPELKLAALAGSTSEEFARNSLPRAKLVTTERLEGGIEKVMRGEVDALVADRETCSFAVLRFPDAGLIAAEAAFTVEPMGIAVRQDEPQLANLIRTYLTALDDSGVLGRAKQFWFKDPSWVKDLR